MNNIIFSLYIDIPESELDYQPPHYGSKISKTLHTKQQLKKYYDWLKEMQVNYAKSIGLQRLVATQFGGAVINACHALESAPGCHFKFAKPQEGGGSIWDYAATACLYQEAGAWVSDAFGEPLDLNRPDSTFMNHRGAVYATDPILASKILTILMD